MVESGGRCYDQNSLRFSPIFCKNQCFDQLFLHNLALFRVKNANCLADFVSNNIFKIVTSVPGKVLSTKNWHRNVSRQGERIEPDFSVLVVVQVGPRVAALLALAPDLLPRAVELLVRPWKCTISGTFTSSGTDVMITMFCDFRQF
jgi:hypothetical protein